MHSLHYLQKLLMGGLRIGVALRHLLTCSLLQRSPAEGLALVPRLLPSRLAQHTGTLWGNREGCLRSEDTDLSALLTQG